MVPVHGLLCYLECFTWRSCSASVLRAKSGGPLVCCKGAERSLSTWSPCELGKERSDWLEGRLLILPKTFIWMSQAFLIFLGPLTAEDFT